jgi:hypothetical protein
MSTLAFVLDVLAAFLDPVQAGIVLAVVLVHRGPLPVIVAGAVAALVSETVLALAADAYTWGELVAPRMVSALLQAAVLYWVVRWVRSIRTGIGASQAGPRGSAGNAAAMLGSLAGGGALPHAGRTPPGHVRAYMGRRIGRLRVR